MCYNFITHINGDTRVLSNEVKNCIVEILETMTYSRKDKTTNE